MQFLDPIPASSSSKTALASRAQDAASWRSAGLTVGVVANGPRIGIPWILCANVRAQLQVQRPVSGQLR